MRRRGRFTKAESGGRRRNRLFAFDGRGRTHVYACTRATGCRTRRSKPSATPVERNDVNYQTDARDLVGPLDSQVMERVHFVNRNMLVNATKEVARRGTTAI